MEILNVHENFIKIDKRKIYCLQTYIIKLITLIFNSNLNLQL